MGLSHRIKLFFTQNTRLIVGVLLVAALLGLLGAGYIFTSPPTGTVTNEQNVQRVTLSTTTSALVTGNSTMFERGERIYDRSTYFVQSAPEMTLHVQISAPPSQEVPISYRAHVSIIGQRNGDPFYRNTTMLANGQTQTSTGAVNISIPVDVSTLQQRLGMAQAETQGFGRFNLNIGMNASYEVDQYAGELEASVPLVISGRAYYLDGELADTSRHSTLSRETVQQQPNPFEYGSLLGLSALLIGMAGLVGKISETADPEKLRTRIIHSRHDEWISRGEFPTGSDKQYISILTLEDLVDVAIDMNRRVIHDPELDIYAVIDTSEIYYYSVEEESTGAWLDL